jgi:3-deoxy-D-manno-octulosonic-acid transferase
MLRRRARRGKEISARLPERFGLGKVDRPPGPLLWLHAASVGETLSVLPLLPLLSVQAHILFTTGTVTSAELLAKRLAAAGAAAWAKRVTHRFIPLDVPNWARAFLDGWRPDAVCFVESEIWPNLLAACRIRGIPLCLINARLSERSARRWRLAGGWLREMLGGFRWIAAQSEADASRLRRLGAHRVMAVGDLKLAAERLPVDGAELRRLSEVLGRRPAWLAASTHPGEEAAVAHVHRRLLNRFPNLLTVVVPRHPDRGRDVATLLGNAPRRSLGQDPTTHGFWLGDTLGELGLFYRLIPVVFLGKSLAAAGVAGGQNPWEPARLGCAIASGTATANFADAVRRLSASGALTIVPDEAALAGWVEQMLVDPAGKHRAAAGLAAEATASAEGDLPQRIAAMIAELLP